MIEGIQSRLTAQCAFLSPLSYTAWPASYASAIHSGESRDIIPATFCHQARLAPAEQGGVPWTRPGTAATALRRSWWS